MIEKFQKRAKNRKIVAYTLLSLSILVIMCSIVLVILQLQDLKGEEETDILNIVSRLSFIALVTYISQMMQRLYRYNILKADYFLSCADSLTLSAALTEKENDKFIKTLSCFFCTEINLNETEAPNLPFDTLDKKK